MSISFAFQSALVAFLRSNALVTNCVSGAVYDGAPSDRAYPCIVIGPSDFTPVFGDGLNGRTETVQIDVWHQDQGRLNPCKVTVDAVYAAIHETQLSLAEPFRLVRMHVSLVRVFPDPDGITAHGVIQVEADLEAH